MSHFLDRLNHFSNPREPFSGTFGVTTAEDRTWEEATETAGPMTRWYAAPTV